MTHNYLLVPTQQLDRVPERFCQYRTIQKRALVKTTLAGRFCVSLIAGLAVLYAVKLRKSSTPRTKHFQSMTITRVTNEGNVETAAVSPDGKYIAYSLEESGSAVFGPSTWGPEAAFR